MATTRLFFDANYSHDGTKVVYISDLDFSTPGTDDNGFPDIYVADLIEGLTQDASTRVLVSTSSNGAQHGVSSIASPSFSSDGNKVVFSISTGLFNPADTNAKSDIYVKNLTNGQTTQVSTHSDGTQLILTTGEGAANPSFSPDGTKVIFNAKEVNIDYQYQKSHHRHTHMRFARSAA